MSRKPVLALIAAAVLAAAFAAPAAATANPPVKKAPAPSCRFVSTEAHGQAAIVRYTCS